jgi:hypothetical protein
VQGGCVSLSVRGGLHGEQCNKASAKHALRSKKKQHIKVAVPHLRQIQQGARRALLSTTESRSCRVDSRTIPTRTPPKSSPHVVCALPKTPKRQPAEVTVKQIGECMPTQLPLVSATHGDVSSSPSPAAAVAHWAIVSMAGKVVLHRVGAGTPEKAKQSPAEYLQHVTLRKGVSHFQSVVHARQGIEQSSITGSKARDGCAERVRANIRALITQDGAPARRRCTHSFGVVSSGAPSNRPRTQMQQCSSHTLVPDTVHRTAPRCMQGVPRWETLATWAAPRSVS